MIEYQTLLDYTFFLLGKRRLTEKQLREKLQKKCFLKNKNKNRDIDRDSLRNNTHDDFNDESSSLIQRAIEHVKELKYIDDFAYAESFIRDVMQYRPHGSMWIKQKLFQKGISNEIISETLKAIKEKTDGNRNAGDSDVHDQDNLSCGSSNAEYQGAVTVAQKKYQLLARYEPSKKREKLLRFLLGRGYSSTIALEAVTEICHSCEK